MRKINTIIFDLDGVLTDTSDLHYHALRDAIVYHCNNKHLSKNQYDSLGAIPTSERLKKLVARKFLKNDQLLLRAIERKKQYLTYKEAASLNKDEKLIAFISGLKKDFKIGIASNATDGFVRLVTKSTGIYNHLDAIVGNRCVSRPKPYSDIYVLAMHLLVSFPKETMIVEDSLVGLLAAYRSGASVYKVSSPSDLMDNNIFQGIVYNL